MIPLQRAYGETTNNCGYFPAKYQAEHFRKLVQRLHRDFDKVIGMCDADAIVVHGTSGTAVAFALQMLRSYPLVMLRKPGESSHGSTVEGNIHRFHRYVFLDDFISSGTTLRHVRDSLCGAELAGIWLHGGGEDSTYRGDRLIESEYWCSRTDSRIPKFIYP